jgi:urease accessory protein
VYRGDYPGSVPAGRHLPVIETIPGRVRSHGVIDMSFVQSHGSTALARSYQAGCLRMRVPRRAEVDRPCAVLINTSGGLAEGDVLRQRLVWDARSKAVVTTQAAEKVYRALENGCSIETHIEVAQGAEAEWLPQETILFDRARLRRDTRIELHAEASFLGVEAIVLGRTAMNERMREGMLRDGLRIRRDGKLIYADVLDLDGEIESLMRRRTIGNGGCAMAVILHVAAKAATLLDPLREALAGAASLVAASSWNGILAARLVAPDGATLRRDVMMALAVLRGRRPLPRVWSC